METIDPNAVGRRSKDASRPWTWSIAMYAGTSPLRLGPAPGAVNPVISAASVTDVPARFVADPFMVQADGLWHMFFEVLNNHSNKGDIGRATSRDGLTWHYERIVLQEPFHLSYPYVFRWNDDFYMTLETLGANAVRLYRAAPFPDRWILVKDMIPGPHADPSIFQHQGKWWLFTCPTPHKHDRLALYSAADPLANWTEHPSSPIISGNKSIARPGGRVLDYDDGLLRFTQDCYPTYGKQVRAFEITELTSTTYKEHEVAESPVLVPDGNSWNVSGMHHVDAHRVEGSWLACVDGLVDF
ncbi:MAG TPA: hypothetical protein VGH51_12110 [Candidatus Angelobacter sp.]|jgi:hypothetical protein